MKEMLRGVGLNGLLGCPLNVTCYLFAIVIHEQQDVAPERSLDSPLCLEDSL